LKIFYDGSKQHTFIGVIKRINLKSLSYEELEIIERWYNKILLQPTKVLKPNGSLEVVLNYSDYRISTKTIEMIKKKGVL